MIRKGAGRLLYIVLFATSLAAHGADTLPMSTVFKGDDKFEAVKRRAVIEDWASYPIGQRVAIAGRALLNTRYKGYTLEIDNHIEAPSVNFTGLDCWTFFETSLALARMVGEPKENWTEQTLLKYIELDRYRGGQCDGTYLSRLHYLEDWYFDNSKRGLIQDLTRELGGVRVPHSADEMSLHWRSYRYMAANPALRAGIHAMEQRVSRMALYQIPKSRVAAIEPQIHTGDIIGITTIDRGGIGTSHVGIAYRTQDGVLHFMHASSPSNYGRTVLDTRLSDYLHRYADDTGIMVGRPLK
ncbi:MAG TPA: N-acetylmuramoyl-L-alanine amidase-like domain-containing protein [Chthoniobacteraceae bacterium]|nr:N-acetylmuramoyl-L-alanine amidase-like domain-containing protein [Chthoniobacteraceae bacterium]